jgi:neutral ceramidase
MINIGMWENNITPPLGCDIPGQLYIRKSSGIKDELFAKSIVLDNGDNILAIIAIDLLCISEEDVKKIRERVEFYTKIPKSHIMISATHTHTGAPISNIYGSSRDEAYMDYMIRKVADSAIVAYNNRKPSKIGYGVGYEDSIAFNRRFFMKDGSLRTNPGIMNPEIDKPAGPIDPEVSMLRIDDEHGNPKGIILNYACHLDVVGGTEYSADYPGELSRILKRLFGQDFICIFLTGTCGNINHVDATGKLTIKPGHYKLMGRTLAGEVIKSWEKIAALDNQILLNAKNSIITVNLRKPREDEILSAMKLLAMESESKSSESKPDSSSCEDFFARELINAAENNPESKQVEVQVIRVGDITITGLPGEVFVEFGLDIKNRSPFKNNMVSTLTNGSNGYIAICEAFKQGGYETKLSTYTNLEPEAGYRMVDTAIDIMKGFFK